MHVGAPQLKSWASDNAFGRQSYSAGITGTRNWLFVKVYTDESLVGIGECSGWPRVIEMARSGGCSASAFPCTPISIHVAWQPLVTDSEVTQGAGGVPATCGAASP